MYGLFPMLEHTVTSERKVRNESEPELPWPAGLPHSWVTSYDSKTSSTVSQATSPIKKPKMRVVNIATSITHKYNFP